jgi:hypothetical protein
MPFVVDSGSATAAQHESNHLYAELVQVLSKLKIPLLPGREIEEIDQAPAIDVVVEGEIVEETETSRSLLQEERSIGLLEEAVAERLKGSDDPQQLEASPVRLLAPGDKIQLKVGDEAITSDWATFPEALKLLPPEKVIEVIQAVEQPESTTVNQISSSLDVSKDSGEAVDPIHFIVNGVPQFQRSESGEISLNNLHPVAVSVQSETAERQVNQTATVQSISETLDTPTEPQTSEAEAVVFPRTSAISDSTAQDRQAVAMEAPQAEAAKIPPVIAIESIHSSESEPLENQHSEAASTSSFTPAELASEEINHEPENQLLPLGEIERVTGQEIGSGPLHNQVIQQSPSMTAHRNASGQFTATQSIKAHVEATEDEVETEAILQAENQEQQPANVSLPIEVIDLSPGDQSIFASLDSFFQRNQAEIELPISDRNWRVAIQPQDNGGFVATSEDGRALSFSGENATGDPSLVISVSELAQKAIEAALVYNASCQAVETCEDIERA